MIATPLRITASFCGGKMMAESRVELRRPFA